MSALLIAALILALATAFLEIRIMRRVKFLQALTQRFGAFGILMSLFLAVILGTIFGAAGLTVMIAGVVGTAFTQPYHSWQHRKANMSDEQRATLGERVDEVKATYMPIFKFIKYAFLLVTMPLWLPVKIRRWWLRTFSSKPKASDYATAA